jgi:hypothetical protein
MTENKTILDNVVRWLNAGYPEGVPPKDYFPLLALPPRAERRCPRDPLGSSSRGDHFLVSRRSGCVSGTCTKINVTPSGSVTYISCRPHGSCLAALAITTLRPSSSAWVA